MKLALMQPYLFAYIGYFQLMQAVDKFIFYDDVNFIKQGWINRNRILISGKPSYITVPLQNASSFSLIKDTTIAGYLNWQSKWLKTLSLSYKQAPFFSDVYPLVESVVASGQSTISTLAINSVKAINNYLEIPTKIVETSSIYNNNHLSGEQRVLDICKQEGCGEYFNSARGIDLYSRENFNNHAIQLHFLQSGDIQYHQGSEKFFPNLSIIDVLMHNSKDQVQQFLKNYHLISSPLPLWERSPQRGG